MKKDTHTSIGSGILGVVSGIAYAKNQRILVIDDNPNINKVWRQLLEEVDADSGTEDGFAHFSASSDYVASEGFEIDSAFQGQEGLEKIRHAFQEGRPYAVVIVDVRMPPGWDGVKTIERIWKEYPDLPAAIYAPYSDYSASEIVDILGRSEKLLILKNPPDNEAIHQFAVDLTKEWECNQATRFEQLLKRAAKEPLANIFDPDWTRKLAENGDVRCMSDLGHAYLTGYPGVSQDRSQAIRWLREAARLGNKDAKDKLVEIGEMTLTDRYNTLPEWIRWILCWPLSFIIAALSSWLLLFVNGEYIPSFIIGVVHPPLCQAILLVCIYLTVPRAKLAVLLTFIILRSLVLVMFIVSAGVTLLGLEEIVTFDTGYLRATLGEVAVLLVSVVLWKEARNMRSKEHEDSHETGENDHN